MAEFVPVRKVSELPPGHMTWVAVDRERVLLVNVNGAFYALRDVCGHQRAALSKGRLEGYVVRVPLAFRALRCAYGRVAQRPGGRGGAVL